MKKIILITICVFAAFAGGGFYYHILTKAELLRIEKPIPFESFWTVNWKGRNGEFSSNVTYEQAVFLTESEAIGFRDSLENAFKLLRITGSENDVRITKQNNPAHE